LPSILVVNQRGLIVLNIFASARNFLYEDKSRLRKSICQTCKPVKKFQLEVEESFAKVMKLIIAWQGIIIKRPLF
jgi:uncharacterized protein (DUF2141 family)